MLAAELDIDKCEWNVFTTLLSHAILRIISKYVGPDFSWSTGDPALGVKPHIAIPLLKVADDVEVSTGSLASASSPIREGADSKLARVSSPSEIEAGMSVATTVTFRSKMYYVDLQGWKACDLPLVKGIPLEAFWGDAPLRICVYEEGGGGRGRKDIMTLQINNPEHTRSKFNDNEFDGGAGP